MSANLNPQIVARVRRGMAFLDQRMPGWRNRINRSTLDISTHHQCVMGQLYGHYFDGCMWLGIDQDQAVRLGFNAGDTDINSLSRLLYGLAHVRATFADLNEAWQQELAA